MSGYTNHFEDESVPGGVLVALLLTPVIAGTVGLMLLSILVH